MSITNSTRAEPSPPPLSRVGANGPHQREVKGRPLPGDGPMSVARAQQTASGEFIACESFKASA
jgi:hypothetical protein